MGYTLVVVRVKAGFPWAVRATMEGVSRYRGFRYKAEAERDLLTWLDMSDMFFGREFNHNFDDADSLGIKDVIHN